MMRVLRLSVCNLENEYHRGVFAMVSESMVAESDEASA
jgi:hypothetical protein